MKKSVFGLILILMFITLGFVSAEQCVIKERSQCGSEETAVMGLFKETNSHAELISESNYDYVLCCDFEGETTCQGNNKIIGLSDVTNAHAEIPSLDSYSQEVCYGDLNCVARTDSCNVDEIGVLSLSSDTNAHVGNFNEYSRKICCKGMCEINEEFIDGECILLTSSIWADLNGNPITEKTIVQDFTKVKIIVKNSGLSQGQSLNIEIYEDDLLADDSIRTLEMGNSLSAIADSDGKVTAEWTIKQEDIEKAGNEENYNFYFTIPSLGEIDGTGVGNTLKVNLLEGSSQATCIENITRCRDYSDQNSCEEDPCGVASASVEDNNQDIVCESDSYSCNCVWDEAENICESSWSETQEIMNESDSTGDIDGDEVLNINDSDIDGDGIDNIHDPDFDGDGNLDSPYTNIDPNGDIDGDGIINIDDEDMDGDGVLNGHDPDFDGDGEQERYFVAAADTSKISIGTCFYSEGTEDDCSDGVLEYSWIGNWQWGEENSFTGEQYSTDSDYVLISGTYKYDPLNENEKRSSEKCSDGSNIIKCPERIEVPFFSLFNFIISIILLVVIYAIIINKKELYLKIYK